jgi:hypothetical protein
MHGKHTLMATKAANAGKMDSCCPSQTSEKLPRSPGPSPCFHHRCVRHLRPCRELSKHLKECILCKGSTESMPANTSSSECMIHDSISALYYSGAKEAGLQCKEGLTSNLSPAPAQAQNYSIANMLALTTL